MPKITTGNPIVDLLLPIGAAYLRDQYNTDNRYDFSFSRGRVDTYMPIIDQYGKLVTPNLPKNPFQSPAIDYGYPQFPHQVRPGPLPPTVVIDVPDGDPKDDLPPAKRKRIENAAISKEISISGGFHEQWIGPEGHAARAKRRNVEVEQQRLLEQAVAFGVGSTTGPGAFNAAERIREVQWYTTGTFTTGWNVSSGLQGECNYKIVAPYWPMAARALREQFFANTNAPADTSRIGAVGVWEAKATWTLQCGTADPAELTVFALWPKHDLPASIVTEATDTYWFEYDPGASAQGPYTHGIFRYATETPVGAAAAIEVPTFDVRTNAVPTIVNTEMPTCLTRCFGDTKINSATFTGAQDWDAYHYYNSPQDFKCLTANFDIKPVYHRWMRAGDTSILHAACPWSFQVGNDYVQQARDPNPENKFVTDTRDEYRFAWRKKYGPLYLFRIRGSIVFNNAEQTGMDPPPAEQKSYVPKQQINFGSALLNHVSRYAWQVSSIPYPEESFIYQTIATTNLQVQDNFNFDDERHATLDYPAVVGETGVPPP